MNITGGKFNSRKVKTPENKGVRPTLSKIRAGVFDVLRAKYNSDFSSLSFLDVFSVSVIMSIEAVSRGFMDVISIEKNYSVAKIIKENFSSLGLTQNLIIKDSITVLENMKDEKFDVIYLDPPYNKIELYNKTLQIISDKNLLNDNGVIIVEKQAGIEKELGEIILPSSLNLLKEKTYGNTILSFYEAN